MSNPQSQHPRSRTRWLHVLGVLLFGFVVGLYTATQISHNDSPLAALQRMTGLAPNAQKVYDEVLANIRSSYVKQPIDEQTLFYGAIAGLVGSLDDPYTTFFTPEGAKAFQNDLDLSIEGIGAEIGFKDKQLAIIAPLPDSPAQKAGLKAGDRILTVDSTDVTSMTIDAAVKLIRGKAGTKVVMGIIRGTEEKSVTITREKITISSVVGKRLDGDIAYVQVVSFNDDTMSKFDTLVREFLLNPPKGIILDVRNNPGGLLNTSVQLTAEFIGKDIVVREQDAQGKERVERGDRNASLPNTPLVVLVNGGSASASEILAGALQDTKRAQVVGSKTFGKGSVQTLNDLSGGAQLKLTVAKWLTPNGRSIDGEGITPDVIVADPTEPGEDQDTQLQRALDILRKQ